MNKYTDITNWVEDIGSYDYLNDIFTSTEQYQIYDELLRDELRQIYYDSHNYKWEPIETSIAIAEAYMIIIIERARRGLFRI